MWGAARRAELLRKYRERRELYASQARAEGLVYDEKKVIRDIRARLVARGAAPRARAFGGIHTFTFLPSYTWHDQLLFDISELGPVSRYDYRKRGFGWEKFYAADRAGLESRRQMNGEFLSAVLNAHRERPIDWIFVYGSGIEVSSNTIRRIREETGVPTVNMCLDDKQSWSEPWMGDHRGGQVDIGREFDISWTSARVACEWYLVEGARPIYLPEGFDSRTYRPVDTPVDLPVSFCGGAYGFRPSVIRYLRAHDVDVHAFGQGWAKESRWTNDFATIFCRSAVNLGMGGVGYSEMLTNVKGRDFEVPGTGGGVYLTSYNPDLAQHFVIGREILCYRHRDEMLELLRHYLAHPSEAREIAVRARERSLKEHRWLNRFEKICRILGVLAPETYEGKITSDS
jgi:hypothetical protein